MFMTTERFNERILWGIIIGNTPRSMLSSKCALCVKSETLETAQYLDTISMTGLYGKFNHREI